MTKNIKNKLKLKQNPILLPNTTLVDDVFKVVVYLLSLVKQDFKNIPYLPDLNEDVVTDMIFEFESLFGCITDFKQAATSAANVLNIIDNLILKFETFLSPLGVTNVDISEDDYLDYQSLISDQHLSPNTKNVKQNPIGNLGSFYEPAYEDDEDGDVETAFQSIYETLKKAKSLLQQTSLKESAHLLLNDILTETDRILDVLGLLYTMCPGVRRVPCLSYETEQVIKEVKPTLPKGWEMIPSFLLSDTFLSATSDSDETKKLLGMDAELVIQIRKISTSELASVVESKDGREIVICVYCIPIKDQHLPNELSTIYSSIAHEVLHIYQHAMSRLRKEDFTGLPFLRNDTITQTIYSAQAEQILKDLFSTQGLDPSVVDFYLLDDIEFYTLLFDEIILFIKQTQEQGVCLRGTNGETYVDTENAMYDFISNRPFFQSLKYVQPYKYNIAISDFITALKDRLDELENDFVCKVVTPSRVFTSKTSSR